MEEDSFRNLLQDNHPQFASLFDQYFDRVFRYVFSRTNNRQVAEDLSSQVFLRIFQAYPRYQSRRPLAVWVFTIAKNTLYSHYRFTLHHPVQSLDQAGLMASSSMHASLGNFIDIDRYLDLERAINQLHENERELLRLRYAAGLSFSEIGVLLGKSPAAIKMKIHRLLRTIEDGMESAK